MEAIRQPDLEIPVNYKKLSPGLCLALDDYDKEGPPALLRYSHTLGVVPGANDLEPSRMPVFVLCAPEAELGHLEEHGIQVNQGSGRVRTAFVPLESMTRLTEQPEVERVMASHTLRPLMDVASKRCNLPQFRTRMPLTGKGVVIGIIDSGIDSGHPAFSGRIHSIWDQTLPGSGVLEAGFGRELKGLQLSKSQDADGHGTHVAGIAAGDHSSLGGIAPQATLVVVKTDFNDAHIADGIRYIARIAREQDRPFVINLSLGGHNDPHDGTDPLSATIDEISGPGGIVCCAAGNEGNDNIHAGVLLAPNSRKTIRFRIPANTVTGVLLNGWYPGANRLEVAVPAS